MRPNAILGLLFPCVGHSSPFDARQYLAVQLFDLLSPNGDFFIKGRVADACRRLPTPDCESTIRSEFRTHPSEPDPEIPDLKMRMRARNAV
jgi:hypothetical protein